MTLTPSQLHILQHSLGCDKYGASTTPLTNEQDGCYGYYRNRYVGDPDDDLNALVAAGFMVGSAPVNTFGGMCHYHVTSEGIAAMIMQSPRAPVLSCSQQRYRQWLREDGCMSFGEWLKHRRYLSYIGRT